MPRQQQVTILPQAIKAWRKERDMSQADLAAKPGCPSEGMIAQIETGRRQPGLSNALAIAKAFDVPIGAIAIVHDIAAITTAVEQQVA